MLKKILIVGLLLLLIGGGIGFYLFNKKVPGLEDVNPDFSLTSNELFDAFEADETAALAKYENKVIAVTGEVSGIVSNESGFSVILAAENAMIGGVNCSFREPAKDITEGSTITVKGRCQGFLMDVVLNNCVLAQ